MRGSERDLPVAGEFATPQGPAVSRQGAWGEMNIVLERAPGGLDTAPYFRGLPDDRCQCPHWGYVVRGRLRVRYADREEVLVAGDAYYLAPGHTTYTEEATELVEFSPLGAYQRTMAAVARNVAAAP
ncbi:MAG TPA: hypothetical protein VFL91_20745 [Thermomicrobiales bacterium]|nr:hypothetical protein [Thermomicrobiales bacterium]